MTPFETLTLATYFCVLVILAVYGWHRYYLVYLYMKNRDKGPTAVVPLDPTPVVTIQLPLYNEMYVADRLIEAMNESEREVGLRKKIGLIYLTAADPQAAKTNEAPLGKEGGFSLVLNDRYLMWIGVLVILLNVVNSTGNFLMYNLVEAHANTIADVNEKRQYVALFQGSFHRTHGLRGQVVGFDLIHRVGVFDLVGRGRPEGFRIDELDTPLVPRRDAHGRRGASGR
jgi:hypothetical protein